MISLQETLLYYDGPQLFVAVDRVNTRYLCVMFSQSNEGDQCLCAPISPRRLAEFKLGNMDLRSIFEYPEMDTCFVGSITDKYDSIAIEQVNPKDVKEEWLPEAGFIFPKEPETGSEVQKAAATENRAIIDVSVHPPEARGSAKISPAHLIDVVESFQLAVKYAYKQGLRWLGADQEDDYKSSIAHSMNITAFTPGSFKIRFESESSADMLGSVHLAIALRKLDELTEHVNDPQAALEIMQQNKGHFASAYMKLLESIIENDAPLSYSWSAPDSEQPTFRQITKQQAIPLYELFKSQLELTRVKIEIIGHVIKVNTKAGTWTIRKSDDYKEVSGVLHEDSTQDLAGIVVEDVEYCFSCLETIEETAGTGRKKTNLKMLYYAPANDELR